MANWSDLFTGGGGSGGAAAPLNSLVKLTPNAPDLYQSPEGDEYLKSGNTFIDYANDYPNSIKAFPVVGDIDNTTFTPTDSLYDLSWSAINGGTWWALERNSGTSTIYFREYDATTFTPTGNEVTPNTSFSFSQSLICVASNGDVYIYDNANNVLKRYFSTGGQSFSVNVDADFCRSIYFDETNNLVIALKGNVNGSYVEAYNALNGGSFSVSPEFIDPAVTASTIIPYHPQLGNYYIITNAKVYKTSGVNLPSITLEYQKPITANTGNVNAARVITEEEEITAVTNSDEIIDIMTGVGVVDPITDTSDGITYHTRIK